MQRKSTGSSTQKRKSTGNKIWNKIKGFGKNIWGKIKGIAGKVLDPLTKDLTEQAGNIGKKKLEDLFGGIDKTARGGMDKIAELVK